MTTERTKTGLEAESLVSSHLAGKGYTILDRNWRRPWGELDIVASYRGVVHFVEVKASRANVAGFEPFLRADGHKMHKVQRTAQTWLATKRCGPDTEWQLDIVSVVLAPEGPKIEVFENI